MGFASEWRRVMDLSPDQLRVHDAVLDWLRNPREKLLTLGGAAGSGKSTLLGELSKHFPTPTAYVTPTGRAASVLARKLVESGTRVTKLQRPPDGKKLSAKWRHLFDASLPEGGGPPLCTTYHRLLLRPIVDSQTEELLGWQDRDDMDRRYKLIVVDEASMVSDSMFLKIRARGVPILAVGDHWQLPPVRDFGTLMKNPTLRLEQVHRQAEGSPIVALSRFVYEGGRIRDFKGWNADCVLRQKNEEEVVVREMLTENRLSVVAIAWTNKTRVKFNRLARDIQGYSGVPVIGEPLVSLHNYGPICNGSRGLLAKESFLDERRDWILHANVEFPEDSMAGEWHELNGHQFNRPHKFEKVDELRSLGIPAETIGGGGRLFDFSYCMTCHRAQGSQFDHDIVLYERDRFDEESRRWNYTSISRAAKKLTILLT